MEYQDVNEKLNESIRLMGKAMEAATLPLCRGINDLSAAFASQSVLAEEAVANWVEAFSKIDLAAPRDMSDELNIEFGHWEAVSPEAFDRITPDERWEYQKWVWGAPKRWVSSLVECLREPHP